MDAIVGLDTETVDGRAILIATPNNYVEPDSFRDVVGFLNTHSKRGSMYFTFNLRYDAQAVLKWIDDLELYQKLYDDLVVEYEGVKIKYIPRKFLGLSVYKNCVKMFDIAQFYGYWSLEKTAKFYLNMDKMDGVDVKRLGSDYSYYIENRDKIIEYCKRDAYLTQILAEKMRDSLAEVGFKFKNPYSQAKVSQDYVHEHYRYPWVPRGLKKKHGFAQLCYHGGIFETRRRGLFEYPLYSYDINAAYPSEMVNLPNWRDGRFEDVKSPDECDTRYGWFLCEFDCQWIPYADLSSPYEVSYRYGMYPPVQQLVNPVRILYPTGKRRQPITKLEYEWMIKNGFDVKFEDGFVWERRSSKYPSPFEWLSDVYYARKDMDEKDVIGLALKICMNGIYGKTAQYKKKRGLLTNFFYSSYITAGTRLKMAEIAQKYPDNVLEIATDSILLDRKISLNISELMGRWSVRRYLKGVLVGSGIRQMFTLDGEFITHARGLTDRPDWDMKADIEENLDESEIQFTKYRPIQMGEMLAHKNMFTKDDLNVFYNVTKKLDVNTDKKHVWDRSYYDFGEFMEHESRASPMDIQDLREAKFQKAYAYVKKRYTAWHEDLPDDLIDREAYWDSTLTRHENEEILRNVWRKAKEEMI